MIFVADNQEKGVPGRTGEENILIMCAARE